MEIFDISNISYAYPDGKKALDDVSVKVKQGESLTIIGTNGSGKSTLLYILNGLLMPESGDAKAFGRPLDAYAEFRQRVSLLFQNPQVQLFSLSVWDDLCFGPAQLGLGHAETGKRASDILKLMGIEHLKDKGPWNLSGGEMKKVALGTCLSINPDVLLLDEPTTGLDPRSQVELIDLINSLRKSGKTIVTSTHDLGIIEDISDRTIVLGEDHKIRLEGKPCEVMKDTDALLRANLIHKHIHKHSWFVHEHSHAGLHEHEHMPDIADAVPLRTDAFQETAQKGAGAITELEKLTKLLEHWAEHNREHAETYLQWAVKAGDLDKMHLAGILRVIAEETEKLNELFERAGKSLRQDRD